MKAFLSWVLIGRLRVVVVVKERLSNASAIGSRNRH